MKKQIIIVEDDPFSQEFYKLLFEKIGYKTVITEDGDNLVENLDSKSTALIIMDINLRNTYLKGEKIDGVNLSRIIKENPAHSNIPILLVTAYSDFIVESKYFEQSLAEDYILKPITDFNKLIDKVKKLTVS